MAARCRSRCVVVVSPGTAVAPGRNDDRGLRMTFGHGIVNGLAIIRAVCGHRCNVSIDLIEQFRHFGNVADIVRRQFHGDDFMRVGINAEVQLAPAAARPDTMFLIQPFALAVNLEAGAVDEEMQRLVAIDPVWQDRQAAAATAQGRVIGDRISTSSTSAIDRSRPSV